MLKKLFIGGVLFFVLAIGIAVYFLFIRSSTPSKQNIITTDFPISGDRPVASIPTNGGGNSQVSSVNPFLSSDLVRVASAPSAGGAPYVQSSTTLIRYVDKKDGHITDINTSTGNSIKVTNNTIPKIYDASFSLNGSSTVIRYLNDSNDLIQSYQYISRTSSTTEIQGKFLGINAEALVHSPSGKQLFYIQKQIKGVKGILVNITNDTEKSIFESNHGEWNVAWPEENTIVLTTKPSNNYPGYMYFLNPKTGVYKKVLGNINGFTGVVDPTASYIAYTNDTNQLSIFTIKDGTSLRTELVTISDKCAWSAREQGTLYCGVPDELPQASYPDVWYLGFLNTTDSLYKVSISNPVPELVGALKATYNQDIDVINPMVSPMGDFLIFGNKNDYSVWSLKIQSTSNTTQPQV